MNEEKTEGISTETKSETTAETQVVTDAGEENVTEATPKSQEGKLLKEKAKDHWKLLVIAGILIVVFLGAILARNFFVAAVVDGEPISRIDLIRELEARSGEQALDGMIIKKLILKSALEKGITISEEDVNKEIATLEERMSAQGTTLEIALMQQGLTLEQFREQIILQKALEKILADVIAVSDEDVEAYIKETGATVPTGMSEEEFREQVREQIKNQKFGAEAERWITERKEAANIEYLVDYAKPKPVPEVQPAPETSGAPSTTTPEMSTDQEMQPAQ